MSVRRIIYMSTATGAHDDDTLFEILHTSEANNASENVTGLLMYGAGSFLQVLEGPAAAVGRRMARISRDPRHEDIVTVEDVENVSRLFGDWSMAFVREENMREDDRRKIRDLRASVLKDAGIAAGDPGIISFLTRAFLNAVAAEEARSKDLTDGT